MRRLTRLATRTLATGEGALCLDCGGDGQGVYGGACAMCNGKGAVCPMCRGMRFIRFRPRSRHYYPAISVDGNPDVRRCPVCCEGNNVNEDLELAAVLAYIQRQPVQGV